MLKLVPLEITCREKVIFMILEKFVEVKAESALKRKGRGEVVMEELNNNTGLLQNSMDFGPEASYFQNALLAVLKEEPNEEGRMVELSKDWQKELQNLIKGQQVLIVDNLVLS
jgi:hypothetical protein